MKHKENIDKNIYNRSISYSISIYIRMGLRILSGFFIAKFLGPSLFGLKGAFDLTLNYENSSDLGTFTALNREAPYFRGEDNYKKADAAISSTFTVNMGYALVAAIILIVVSQILSFHGSEKKYVDFFFFLGLIIFTNKLLEFLITLLKIDRDFQLLGRIQILYGCIASTTGVLFVYWMGFRGLLLSLLIVNIVCIACMLFAGKSVPRLIISWPLYRHLLKIGLPITVLFFLLVSINSGDKILILWMISEEALGYYTIATVAAGIIAAIPLAIQSITLTPIMETYGHTKDKLSVRPYFSDPVVLLAYFVPLLVAVLYFGTHLPIMYFLDKYIASLAAVKIRIFGNYFDAIAAPALSISFAFNNQLKLILFALPVVVFDFGLNFLLIKAGWGIEGAAFGTSASNFIFFCIIIYHAFKQFGHSWEDYLNFMALLITPVAYTIFLLIALDQLISVRVEDLYMDMLLTAFKMGAFCILYSFIFFRIRKHSALAGLVQYSFLAHFIPLKIKNIFPKP